METAFILSLIKGLAIVAGIIILFYSSCRKQPVEKPATQEELQSAAADLSNGHLMQTRAYTYATVPHPGYPELHATVADTSTAVLSFMFGNNYQLNTDGTYHLGLAGYSFNLLEEASIHAGMSRFYAGVNSIPSINAGLWPGNKTVEYMNTEIKFLKE
ncbi:MAG TPA: hypothetical protein VFH08_00440 [Chitinophagaceae bacterium]|nr:hypothetical protein [Chitinophagaceae bacterium]